MLRLRSRRIVTILSLIPFHPGQEVCGLRMSRYCSGHPLRERTHKSTDLAIRDAGLPRPVSVDSIGKAKSYNHIQCTESEEFAVYLYRYRDKAVTNR